MNCDLLSRCSIACHKPNTSIVTATPRQKGIRIPMHLGQRYSKVG
jgi:hypothetical protein